MYKDLHNIGLIAHTLLSTVSELTIFEGKQALRMNPNVIEQCSQHTERVVTLCCEAVTALLNAAETRLTAAEALQLPWFTEHRCKFSTSEQLYWLDEAETVETGNGGNLPYTRYPVAGLYRSHMDLECAEYSLEMLKNAQKHESLQNILNIYELLRSRQCSRDHLLLPVEVIAEETAYYVITERYATIPTIKLASDEMVRSYTIDLLKALAALHENSVTHG